MRLRERGWSIRAAAREVGVSPTAGWNWARGYKVYRNGKQVGSVPPLDRLAVREINPRFLSQQERIRIADLHREGVSARQIALELGRCPSTVSRELTRNSDKDGNYQPYEAHQRATARRARPKQRRVHTSQALADQVGGLLSRRWSPQQISRHLRAAHPDDPSMHLCHESIYQAIYEPHSVLLRPTPVPSRHRSPLRTGRDHRRAQQRRHRRRPRFDQPMLSIHDRPFGPDDRSQAGHWEGDTIIGKDQGSAIGTLVERKTRTLRLLHLPDRDSDTMHDSLVARMQDLPPHLLRSITWDQGSEMARHQAISADLNVPVYFCDPRAPWQRGSNENSNGLLRQYFPKGIDLSQFSPEHLKAVEDELNNRPRQVLADQAPIAFFNELLASKNH